MNNPVVDLNEFVQKQFDGQLKFTTLRSENEGGVTNVEVELELPCATKFVGKGKNKRLAKKDASMQALKFYNTAE